RQRLRPLPVANRVHETPPALADALAPGPRNGHRSGLDCVNLHSVSPFVPLGSQQYEAARSSPQRQALVMAAVRLWIVWILTVVSPFVPFGPLCAVAALARSRAGSGRRRPRLAARRAGRR